MSRSAALVRAHGEVNRKGGGTVEGTLRLELDRVLAVADRDSNAVLQERGGRWNDTRRSDQGALIVARAETSAHPAGASRPFQVSGRMPVLIGHEA